MLVDPRLHDPTPENAEIFFRWTRLHNPDMLGLKDTGHGTVTKCFRFTAPATDPKYSHLDSASQQPYLYTCNASDIAVFNSQPYYDISRKLDLENTRQLREGEVPVGKEGMVWDVVNAKFALFELVPSGTSFSLPHPSH